MVLALCINHHSTFEHALDSIFDKVFDVCAKFTLFSHPLLPLKVTNEGNIKVELAVKLDYLLSMNHLELLK
jgi:hypothetical protein